MTKRNTELFIRCCIKTWLAQYKKRRRDMANETGEYQSESTGSATVRFSWRINVDRGGGEWQQESEGITPYAAICANADTWASSLSQEDAEKAVLCLINEQRTAISVPPLTLNLNLRAAARQHANDARTIKWWGDPNANLHINPQTHSSPSIRIRDAGYCPSGPSRVGENVYFRVYSNPIDQNGTAPRDAVNWWMQSQGHRENILNINYSEIGVAVVLGVPMRTAFAGGAIFVLTFGKC